MVLYWANWCFKVFSRLNTGNTALIFGFEFHLKFDLSLNKCPSLHFFINSNPSSKAFCLRIALLSSISSFFSFFVIFVLVLFIIVDSIIISIIVEFVIISILSILTFVSFWILFNTIIFLFNVFYPVRFLNL